MLAEEYKTQRPGKQAEQAPDESASEERPTVMAGSPSASSRSRRAPTSRRPKVTARPLHPIEQESVEQTTQLIEVASQLDEQPLSPAVIKQAQPPALPVGSTPSGITIVSGNATSSMVAMRIAPPRRKKRHWVSGMIILTLIAAVSLTAIATVTPLASGKSEGLAVDASGPLGIPVSLDAVNSAPTGHWVAIIGVQPNQDVGGGAGPGVSAPGSAGLPIASVKSAVSTAPAAAATSGISPAPLSPWPPTWAYASVPGYYSFGMTDVGGFYSWAFGQCTWWAQYERRDENLMHMGNAQYWASGARARGYSVGYAPRVGATVVFQPGVQGAGGAGHVAHVVKVYPDNWFLVSEMNFYWNGGGWGRVDYRFAHAGSGVQFIY